MIDRADALWNTPWPRPTIAGLAILLFWTAGILLAAGGLATIAKRFGVAAGRRLPPSPERGLAD